MRCDVVSRTGEVRTRSMVYTEYFARAASPETCSLHDGPGFLSRMAGLFSADHRPSGLPETAGPERAAAVAAPAAEQPQAGRRGRQGEPENEKKKRGFWGRLFGKRNKGEEQKKDP